MTKSQRVWLIAGATALVVAVFCCAAFVTGLIWWLRDDPGDVVDDFLSASRSKDRAAVRELTCADDRSGAMGILTSWTDVVDWEILDEETHDRSAEVTARVTYRVLGFVNSSRLVFVLVREDGDWKVCGVHGD